MDPSCRAAKPHSAHPSLYQVNTRVWLRGLGDKTEGMGTLDDVPDAELDAFAAAGLDWVWLLGVWQIGLASRQVSWTHPHLREEFLEALPDLSEADVTGSGFAIAAYSVAAELGGDEAMSRLRARLRARGLRLMLDFVPNHTGLDHPWVQERPDFFVHGSEQDLARAPGNYTTLTNEGRVMVLAHGRDPYFPGWTDTLQLDYSNPALQEAMRGELMSVAEMCDGVRCDMAMLVHPPVFKRTWGKTAAPFWPTAIRRVRERHADFCFLAEVYWDLESTMLEQGFDYAYDKSLYDKLRAGHPVPVRDHFRTALDYQCKMARFLENHDEPRAAAIFPHGRHQAAAVITYLSPGMRFFHQGQLDGRRKRISPHLGRAPQEYADELLQRFYRRLLDILKSPVLRFGNWRLLECHSVDEHNHSHRNLIAFGWEAANSHLIVVVNYAAHESQCFVRVPFAGVSDRTPRLVEVLWDGRYEPRGDCLDSRGLRLEMAAWSSHVFELRQSHETSGNACCTP